MRKRYEPQDIQAVTAELLGQSDRAAITVGGAIVEYYLEKLIESEFRAPANKTEATYLFSDNGILGTFWEKIWAAYFMRLIGPNLRRELDLIRLIRNEVAHNMNPVTFDLPEIANRCRELKLLHQENVMVSDHKRLFLMTVTMISAALMIKPQRKQLANVVEFTDFFTLFDQ